MLAAATLVLVPAGLALGWWTVRPPPAVAGAPIDDALAGKLDQLLSRLGHPDRPALAMRALDVPAGDAELTALARGLCRDLTGQLARRGTLRVVSCESTAAAPVRTLDDAALGRLLAVDHLLAGRIVRGADGTPQLQLALRRVRDGQVQRALQATLTEADAPTLPHRLAIDVAAAFGGHAAPPTTTLPPALHALMRQAEALSHGDPPARKRALALVDQVLEQVPDHLPAAVMRIGLRDTALHYADPPLPPDAFAEALTALSRDAEALGERLLAEDADDARGRMMLAAVAVGAHDWARAVRLVESLPLEVRGDSGPQRMAAYLLAMAGYHQRAYERALAAARGDPLNPRNHDLMANLYALRGDDARMLAHARVAVDLGLAGAHVYIAVGALHEGDLPGAQAALEAAMRANEIPTGWIGEAVRAFADRSRRARTLANLDAMPDDVKEGRHGFFLEFAWLGDEERALRAVEQAAQHSLGLWFIDVWSPELRSMRGHPRFVEIAQAQGLTTLWTRHGAPDLCRADANGHWRCN